MTYTVVYVGGGEAMCIVCVLFEQGKLTRAEAFSATREVAAEEEHKRELYNRWIRVPISEESVEDGKTGG